MANQISQSFIDELLTRTDIVSVIEPYLTLKKKGTNYVANCPFHQEKTPSFTVSATKQIYHCFGCGVGGNAISFLMAYEHMSFQDVIETLASHVNMEIPKDTFQGNQKRTANYQNFYDIMNKAVHYYYAQLSKKNDSKDAINYLKQRGLSKSVIKKFGIGYASPGWNNLVQTLGQTDDQRQQLLKMGLLIQNEKGSIYDRFRNRIMFPIRDRRGRIIGFGGRVIDNDTPKYMNSPETQIFHKGHELFGLYEARQANPNIKRLLVVEGYMDVISLNQHDVTYAVATLGTATTPHHIQTLFRITSEIVFCFDGDEAGHRAAWHALETAMPLLRDEWQAKFMFLPTNEDPDSMIREEGQTKFEERIQKALPLSTFFFNHLMNQVNMQEIDGKARLASLSLPYIRTMSAEILRAMLLKELARKTQIDIEKLGQAQSNRTSIAPSAHAPETTELNYSMLLRTIIALLIQYPHLAKTIETELPKPNTSGITMLHSLVKLIKANPNLSTGTILEHWRDTPETTYLAELANHDHMVTDKNLESHFQDAIKKLRQLAIDENIDMLLNKNRTEGLTNSEKKLLIELLKKKQNS